MQVLKGCLGATLGFAIGFILLSIYMLPSSLDPSLFNPAIATFFVLSTFALAIAGFIVAIVKYGTKEDNTNASHKYSSNKPATQPDSTSILKSSSNVPSGQKPEGEQLYLEALKKSVNLFTIKSTENRLELLERLIEQYKQALRLGLTKYDQVGCRAALSDTLLCYVNELNIETPDEVACLGLELMPNRLQAIQELEKALEIDSTNENKFFCKKTNQTAYLTNLGTHWNIHGRYLNDTKGADHAISYLTNKIKSLNYLGGTYMPDVCLSIGCYYVSTGNEAEAIEWFKKALSAEEIDKSNQQYEHYKKAKKMAMENINSLESYQNNN